MDPELKRWKTRFAGSEYLFGTVPNAFLAAQAARLTPGMQALCGRRRAQRCVATQGCRSLLIFRRGRRKGALAQRGVWEDQLVYESPN
jgi:hypothetical protein